MTERRRLVVDPDPDLPADLGPWLWAMGDARSRTKEVLADLDPAALDWTPPWRGNTAASLLYHIAAIELDWLYAEVREEPFPDALMTHFPSDVRDADGRLSPVTGETHATLGARLDAVRDALLATFRAMDPADLDRPRSLEPYDVSPRWVLHHLLQHEALHRGQLELIVNTWRRDHAGS